MEHTEFVIGDQQVHPSGTERHGRRPRKKKEKVESILWYLIPFFLINLAIFFYMTARPDFTLVIEDPSNFKNISFTLETSGRLPIHELEAKLDDVPVELEKTSKNHYTATVDRNGTLEVRAAYKNGMSKTQYENISTIDDQPPTIIGEELDASILTVSFEDAQSGVDIKSVYAVDANGDKVAPLEIMEEEHRATFQADTNNLEIHVMDLCGNEAIVNFDGLKLMGNDGENRTGDYNTYGSGSSSSGSSSSGSSSSGSSSSKKSSSGSTSSGSSSSGSSSSSSKKETKAEETKKAKETTAAEETKKAKETTAAEETTKAKETTAAEETTKAKETTAASGTVAPAEAINSSAPGSTTAAASPASQTTAAASPASQTTAAASPASETAAASPASQTTAAASPAAETTAASPQTTAASPAAETTAAQAGPGGSSDSSTSSSGGPGSAATVEAVPGA